MKVEVAVLGSPSLIVCTVSVDVKQHWTNDWTVRARELCERQSGRSGLPVPNSLYGLCRRKATLALNWSNGVGGCVKVEVAVLGSPSLIVLMVSVDVMQR